MANRLPLPELPGVLIEAGYETPTYRTLYEAARDRRYPAQRGKGGRWTFDPQDIPQIADSLGLLAHAA